MTTAQPLDTDAEPGCPPSSAGVTGTSGNVGAGPGAGTRLLGALVPRNASNLGLQLLVAGLLLFGKVLAFAREVAVAHLFGLSSLVDAYVTGMTVLNAVAWLGAALQLVLVPVFVESRERQSGESAGRALTSTLWLSAFFGLVLTVLLYLGARLCVRVVGPGLPAGTARQAVAMVRLLAPIGLASVVTAAANGFQNANRRFAIGRLAEPTVALVSLGALLSLGASRGVLALAGSQTLGYAAAAVVLVVSVWGYLSPARWQELQPMLARLFRLGWPTMAALLLFRLNSVVNRAFASSLHEGSLAALGYAERLYLLPVTLVIATVVTFHYTHAAELAVRGDTHGLARATGRSVAKVALMLVPLSAAIALFARPVVRLAFQRGAFDPAATAITAAVLGVYCLALLPHIVMELLTATMRGLCNMKAPMFAGLATVGVNALLCAFLVHRMGAPGAAAALVGGYTAGALVMTLLTVLELRRARRRADLAGS